MSDLVLFIARRSRNLKVAVGRSIPRKSLEGHDKPGSMIFAEFKNFEFKTYDTGVAEALISNSSYGSEYSLVSEDSTKKLKVAVSPSRLVAADEARARAVKSTAIKSLIKDETLDHIPVEDRETETDETLKLIDYNSGDAVILSTADGDVNGVVVEDAGAKVRLRRCDNDKVVRVSKSNIKIDPNRKVED